MCVRRIVASACGDQGDRRGRARDARPHRPRRAAARAGDAERLRRLAPPGRGDGVAPLRARRDRDRGGLRADRLAHAAAPGDRRGARRAGARGAGTGTFVLRALEAWARDRGATELEGPVQEDDAGSIAWTRATRLRRGGPQLPPRPRPDGDRAARARPASRGSRSSPGPSGPTSRRGLYEVAVEATLDIPGAEEDDIGSLEEWLERDMGGAGDDPRAVFVALAGDEVTGFAKFSLSTREPRARLPRPDRSPPRLARPRDRGGAQAHADRLGEERGLHVAPDLERGPQRADPPPERAARLRRRAGRRHPCAALSTRPERAVDLPLRVAVGDRAALVAAILAAARPRSPPSPCRP